MSINGSIEILTLKKKVWFNPGSVIPDWMKVCKEISLQKKPITELQKVIDEMDLIMGLKKNIEVTFKKKK